MNKKRTYKDYRKRYEKLYDEMNLYEKEKTKYILLSCGGGIASLLPFVLNEEKIDRYKDVKTMFLILFLIGIINIFVLIFSQKSLEKALENENRIISMKLEEEISEKLEEEIRNNNCYKNVTKILDYLTFVLLVLIIFFIIKNF